MARVYSLSVRDEEVQLIAVLEELKRNNNLSNEIVRVLKAFLIPNSNREVISKEMLRIIELERRIDEIRQVLSQLSDIEEELAKLKSEVEKKQEQQKLQDELPLIRELRYSVFDDLDKEGFERFESHMLRLGREPADAIKVRLSKWAAEKQLSMPEAVNLFCKAFPELKHLFEVVEVVM